MVSTRDGEAYEGRVWVTGNPEINNLSVTVVYWKDVRRRGYYLLLHGEKTEPRSHSGIIVSTCMLMSPKNPPRLLLEETQRLSRKRLKELAQIVWGGMTLPVADNPYRAVLERAMENWGVVEGPAPEWTQK